MSHIFHLDLSQLTLPATDNPDDYILIIFGHYFHQKFASPRGIENLLMDFYDSENHLHKLLETIFGYYQLLAERVAKACANGIYGGEDLGCQRSLFMSPAIFRERILFFFNLQIPPQSLCYRGF